MQGFLLHFLSGNDQDAYIFSNDDITFFRCVYVRHTNFAIETFQQNIGNLDFGNSISVIVNKSGDLISKMFLCLEIPQVIPENAYFAWVKRLGHAIIKNMTINIGGTEYDKQYGTWLDIWWELSGNRNIYQAYDAMIGNIPELTSYNSSIKKSYTLMIPLQFWFNRFYTHAFPINNLFYNNFVLTISLEKINKLIVSSKNFCNNLHITNSYLLTQYVFLDTFEKNKILTTLNEYLIEQIQSENIKYLMPNMYNLSDIKLPVKELFWAIKNYNYTSGQQFVYYSDTLIVDNYNNRSEEYLNKIKEINLIEASKLIVLKSISVNIKPENGIWVKVYANSSKLVDTFYIINNNDNKVYVNTSSLKIGELNITGKINVIVTINKEGNIIINELTTSITIMDISIPTTQMIDTRVNDSLDSIVYQFNNYGLYIDGSGSQIKSARILFNGLERITKLSYLYYNYLQPLEHHTNIPCNGIMSYSFALEPEKIQPSGFANFSRIEKIELELFYDNIEYNNYKFLNHDLENNLYIYATNYNILRIDNGFSGLVSN
ncbi:NCLDV major capsid protein [Hokovirus HKV1]|uniref:NCLDV major capsid protein n=1 Tax=Hokovirus HKV1 TaxID=1977638 RepID=A0A1V0SFW0_9VIRU|nr:NCLDV major capsid protein [Hokovirus HKV1]